MRRLPFRLLVVAGGLGISGSLAFVHHPKSAAPGPSEQAAGVNGAPTSADSSAEAASADSSAPPVAALRDPVFSGLPALRFINRNSGESALVRLYDDGGHLDERAAERLDAVLGDTRDAKNWATVTLDRRTLQLAVRAALHFHARELLVVSAYRKPGRRAEGPHAAGKAIDFQLPGVSARALAAYLRALPRVGVGVYTHPKTGFVHLDDREHSFHWLDASPPGRHWREMSLGGGVGMSRRDARYVRADDWPEGTSPPRDATL